MAKKKTARKAAPAAPAVPAAPAAGAPTGTPKFAEPHPTGDPRTFRTKHASDAAAYKILDKESKTLRPLPFDPSRGGVEPVLTLEQVLGNQGPATVSTITSQKQIVFHALGDTGNTRTVGPQNAVTDKLTSDFQEGSAADVPSFLFHLGDVVYSFGEAQYYYDQFYEPYRDYPRPIVAIAGNHDGMVAPGSTARTLAAFLANFCDTEARQTSDAGGLVRTTMIQPGVYYTFEAPFVRILALYSNRLEDPGIISAQGKKYPELTNVQLDYLKAALTRIKKENFDGAVIFAMHHPPYTLGRHGGSPGMLADMDAICKSTGIWPHAVLSGHAHSYQRYTRVTGNMEIPYVIGGNGGHGLTALVRSGNPPIRTPQAISNTPGVTLENYDDKDYGYLRVIVDQQQLRIEYHPASDTGEVKTPNDAVTVSIKDRQIIRYVTAGA